MLRWLKFGVCNIKARHVVTVTFTAWFALLIFALRPMDETNNVSEVHIARQYSADVEGDLGPPKRYNHLQKFLDAQRQNQINYEEFRKVRLNEYKKFQRKRFHEYEDFRRKRHEVKLLRKVNKLRPKPVLSAVDKSIITSKLDLKHKEFVIHNRIKILTGFIMKQNQKEGYISNTDTAVNHVESSNELDREAFDPPDFFTDIKTKIDKIREQQSNKDEGGRNAIQKNMFSQDTSDSKIQNNTPDDRSERLHLKYIAKTAKDIVYYNKEIPLIWVTGHPGSGTTLMRAMLDAHPSIRCGEVTHIIPKILKKHEHLVNAANVDDTVISNAVGAYILTLITQHGKSAQRLCNKDPMTILGGATIKHIFPNSKFIFMIRDGRAVVHSIISRNINFGGLGRTNYTKGIEEWNKIMTQMYYACQRLGPDFCLPVYYEQLILHPRSGMDRILTFLDIDWDELVVNHHKTLDKKGGVSLSMNKHSTDEVERPVNLIPLTSWVEEFPEEVLESIRKVAPLLEIIGYNPDRVPPYYGLPDPEVLQNTKELEKGNRREG